MYVSNIFLSLKLSVISFPDNFDKVNQQKFNYKINNKKYSKLLICSVGKDNFFENRPTSVALRHGKDREVI
jgi:hypothetical protein